MLNVLRALLFAFTAIAATPAPAQTVPPFPGSLVVKITEPPGGARVSGPSTIKADVTKVDGEAVAAAVQFQVDGVDFGPVIWGRPPYLFSVPWDTTTVSDGWHTLTAVGREYNGQLYFTSDPVRVHVANAVPQPAAVRRYEESDPAVSYSPGWLMRDSDWFAWSGGAAIQSAVPGARAVFAFTGPSVTWIGYRSGFSGIARVLVDDVQVAEVDLFARTDEASVRAFTVNGLTDASHTLTIEVTGLKNSEASANLVVIDAFEVYAPAMSRWQQTNPSVAFTGDWTAGDTSKSWSGGTAAISREPQGRATVSFNGTGIAWIGYRGPDAGIASIVLDGQWMGDVDAYSAGQRVQDVLYSVANLPEGSHTLTVEATGRTNPSATDSRIVVDAFDVTLSGARFEGDDWHVSYGQGDWARANRNRAWSGGTASVASQPQSQVSFFFDGTGVRWIGYRGPDARTARVYIDGIPVADVDAYAPTEGIQDTLLEISGLVPGRHSIWVHSTGNEPPPYSKYIVIDAFDVLR